MPELFREGGFRFFFFSNEGDPREPIHMHVRRGAAVAKAWIEPAVAQAKRGQFSGDPLSQSPRRFTQFRWSVWTVWHKDSLSARD